MRWFGINSLLSLLIPGCAPDRVYDEDLIARFDADVFRSDEYGHPLPYRLFVPEGYDASRSYPLILYLHSSGGIGDDNKAQIEPAVSVLVSPVVQDVEKSFVLVPQSPAGVQWVNVSFDSTPFRNYHQDDIPESDGMKMVLEVLTRLQSEYSIDPERLYVMGSSMGGSGTWDIVTRHPHTFAAAITINGVSDPDKAEVIADLPIWAFHGEKDAVSDVNNTRNMIGALRRFGSRCQYTELAGMGHGIATRALEEPGLFPWLFSQSRTRPDSEPSP